MMIPLKNNPIFLFCSEQKQRFTISFLLIHEDMYMYNNK